MMMHWTEVTPSSNGYQLPSNQQAFFSINNDIDLRGGRKTTRNSGTVFNCASLCHTHGKFVPSFYSVPKSLQLDLKCNHDSSLPRHFVNRILPGRHILYLITDSRVTWDSNQTIWTLKQLASLWLPYRDWLGSGSPSTTTLMSNT